MRSLRAPSKRLPATGCRGVRSRTAVFTGALALTLLLALLPAAPADAARNVVAWYPLDDGTAVDASGNGHDGTVVGTPGTEPGMVGNALVFDGDDHVFVPSAPDLEGHFFSLSLWLRLDEAPATDVTVARKIQGGTGFHVGVRAGVGDLALDLREAGVGGASVRTGFPVVVGRWTHVYASYDGGELLLWSDGEQVASAAASSIQAGNTSALVLGAAPGGTQPKLVGAVDDVRWGTLAGTPSDVCDDALKAWDAATTSCLPSFVDVKDELGVADVDHRHFGATLVDVDDDGWIDLYYVNGLTDPDLAVIPPSGTCPDETDPPFEPESVNTFFLNNGDGTFSADMAPELGIDDFWNAMRHVWGDVDNDGVMDMLSHNFVKSTLYRAVPGSDPLAWEGDPGVELCLNRGTGASFVDVDNDGLLDIYAAEYDPSRLAEDHVNVLMLNDGDGTFSDVTAAAGVDLPDNPMGIAFADYDEDGDQDFFVSNSHDAPSRLYRNDGLDPFTGIPMFTDVAPEAGVSVIGEPSRGVGAAWGDYDNDGHLDLLFSREEDSRLWHNDGPNADGLWTFSDVTGEGGLDLQQPGLFFWGGNFADLDNDGWLDVVLTNRGLGGAGSDSANRVFMNNGDGTWREVARTLNMAQPSLESIGFVPGDIDNDGDLDAVLVSHTLGQPNMVLRNDTRGNNWVQFRLTAASGDPDAVGARIEIAAVLTPGTAATRQVREVSAGTGFFSDVPRIQTFGLGKAREVRKVRIRWPSGQTQVLGPLAVNVRHDVTEPELP